MTRDDHAFSALDGFCAYLRLAQMKQRLFLITRDKYWRGAFMDYVRLARYYYKKFLRFA